MDLALIWAILIATAVLLYVVMDGFDLGIGILFPLFPRRQERDLMTNTIAPVWDGNETWLVLGGGGLLAAFPLAYAVLLPALYMPLTLMLLALIFRGVAFEFRWRERLLVGWWDWAFFAGSLVATFCQGIALGALIQGVEADLARRAYVGGWFDWLTPFSVLTGLFLVAGYALLGCGWLILKTEGPVRERCYALARPLAFVLLGAIVLTSLITPILHSAIAERWFSLPNFLVLLPVPLLVLVLWFFLMWSIERRLDPAPFLFTIALFVISYLGLGISLFPYVVPPSITLWDAANPPESLLFLLVGTLILLPMVLAYTGYVYWVFRGKVASDAGYH